MKKLYVLLLLTLLVTSCRREPELHLYDAEQVNLDLPTMEIDLDVYWDYVLDFGIDYDWRADWYYGWDDTDRRTFGELGYTEPSVFNMRHYYTASTPYGPHTSVTAKTLEGTHHTAFLDWGYWDLLAWNQVSTLDGVQSLHFDEQSTLDSVVAYTNPSMHVSRYQAPRFTHAFYAPEPLFSAYERAVDINRDMRGFDYDAKRDIWVKQLHMTLRPITYIYLTQVILHNNKGRIAAVDGSAALSGLARTTTLNSGRGGDDAVTVHYDVRMKRNMPLVAYGTRSEDVSSSVERVDIVGGRLMTFGICGLKANDVTRADEVLDPTHHYMDLTMQFNNGMDSTFVFDVTRQVRSRYKGGVITVELDVDTVPIPRRSGGSGFNAVVLDYEDGGTHEFEM